VPINPSLEAPGTAWFPSPLKTPPKWGSGRQPGPNKGSVRSRPTPSRLVDRHEKYSFKTGFMTAIGFHKWNLTQPPNVAFGDWVRTWAIGDGDAHALMKSWSYGAPLHADKRPQPTYPPNHGAMPAQTSNPAAGH
jgi:hypothetical protein